MGMYIAPQPQLYRDLCNSTDDLANCHRICMETAIYCLRVGGEYSSAVNVRTLTECAELCRTTVEIRNSYGNIPGRTYELCAEMCERSVQVCSAFGDDRVMLGCMDACRRSAAYCRQKAGMTI